MQRVNTVVTNTTHSLSYGAAASQQLEFAVKFIVSG